MFENLLLSDSDRSETSARIAGRASSAAEFHVGKGDAYREALMKKSQIFQIEWYTVPMSTPGVLHSLLAVHIHRGESQHQRQVELDKYIIEKALLSTDEAEPENIRHGVHVSYYEDVRSMLESSPIHVLHSNEIRKPLRMHDLWRTAVTQGPYKVAHCNCHHMAQTLFNYCVVDENLSIRELPNQGLISAAQLLESIGIGADSIPFWSRSQSSKSTSVQSVSSVNMTFIKESLQLVDSKSGGNLMLVLSCPSKFQKAILDLGCCLGGRLKLAFNEEYLDQFQPRDADVWFQIADMTDVWIRNDDRRLQIEMQIATSLWKTKWWTEYLANVKAYILHAAKLLDRSQIHLACIEGGPVSKLEQQRMPQLIEEVKFELRAMGKSYDLRMRQYANLDDFKKGVHGVLSCWWSSTPGLPDEIDKLLEEGPVHFTDICSAKHEVSGSDSDVNFAMQEVACNLKSSVTSDLRDLDFPGFLDNVSSATEGFSWGKGVHEEENAIVRFEPTLSAVVMIHLKKTERVEQFAGRQKHYMQVQYDLYTMRAANEAARRECERRAGEDSWSQWQRLKSRLMTSM